MAGEGLLVESGAPSCKGFRYPAEIIAYCVWLYHRFPLGFREVEELVLARGVIVSHETIRQWCGKFGPDHARALRRRRPRPGDTWHLDEVFIKANGKIRYLWRAVDQDGGVLGILVRDRRATAATGRFFRKLLKDLEYVPRVLVTDGLRGHGAAHREVMPPVEHHGAKYLDNRAENSHQPMRRRERAMKGFRSSGAARRFPAAFSRISGHLRPRRHLITASGYRTGTTDRPHPEDRHQSPHDRLTRMPPARPNAPPAPLNSPAATAT
ncbi:IS6 family transposase [Streptomyces sp. NPDC086782]|uniref:IS6 family transposase n=1 Tax=Streptomyces sp. NPDC086782 TaxID=3365757 RepID=UPI00382F197B